MLYGAATAACGPCDDVLPVPTSMPTQALMASLACLLPLLPAAVATAIQRSSCPAVRATATVYCCCYYCFPLPLPAAADITVCCCCCCQVGYAEVHLSSLDPSSADAQVLSQRLAARQPGTDTWRGFSVSSPFLPGEETRSNLVVKPGSQTWQPDLAVKPCGQSLQDRF
jgi:hypothetical protein